MQIEVEVNDAVLADVELSQIIGAINDLSAPTRWNYMAQILNNFYAGIDELSEEQKQIVKGFLEKKLKVFEEEVV